MIKLAFIDRQTMEEEVGWLNKTGPFWKNTTPCGEALEVDPNSLQILEAHGYERFIGTLLLEGKLRFLKQ